MNDRHPRGNPVIAIAGAFALGTAVVVAAIATERRSPRAADADPAEATVEYGRRLLRETGRLLGPDHPDPAMHYSGTSMACAACHLDVGMEPGTLTLLTAAAKYPRFSGRDGGERDLRDRINGCMVRSMSGRELPRDSAEMTAMVAYITRLGAEHDLMGATRRAADEPPAFAEPDRAASPEAGRVVYERRCMLCHGANGAGLHSADATGGYVFPPLWGPDSYNIGAGMHRVLTAAAFIKARMPLGEANLTDAEAFDVAAYINSHPRPEMSGLDADYADRTTKPIDSPYPPWADPFPAAQHKYGPFAPIREYYKRQRAGSTPDR